MIVARAEKRKYENNRFMGNQRKRGSKTKKYEMMVK